MPRTINVSFKFFIITNPRVHVGKDTLHVTLTVYRRIVIRIYICISAMRVIHGIERFTMPDVFVPGLHL
jgi:hypothetical protein